MRIPKRIRLRHLQPTILTALHNYATADNIDVGLYMLLLQGIVGQLYLLSFRKGWSSVPYAKGDKNRSIEAPFLNI